MEAVCYCHVFLACLQWENHSSFGKHLSQNRILHPHLESTCWRTKFEGRQLGPRGTPATGEGQRLWCTRLLPKMHSPVQLELSHSQFSREIWGWTWKTRILRGRLQEKYPQARLPASVKVFGSTLFPPPSSCSRLLSPHFISPCCNAAAAAFQHSRAWTAPICSPSAPHPCPPLPTPALPSLSSGTSKERGRGDWQ